MQIKIKAKKTACFFLLLVILLTLLHCVAIFLFFHSDNPKVLDFTLWFDLDIENNIPSFYSAASILICSLLFFLTVCLTRKEGSSQTLYWFDLSIIFVFLSADEAFQLHESVGDMLELYINATGFLYFPWTVPYIFLTFIFSLLYMRFLFHLPDRTAKLFLLSGASCFTGAIFFDMMGGREAELHGYDSLIYILLYTAEEFLEMFGIVGILYTALSYIEEKYGYISVTFQLNKAG